MRRCATGAQTACWLTNSASNSSQSCKSDRLVLKQKFSVPSNIKSSLTSCSWLCDCDENVWTFRLFGITGWKRGVWNCCKSGLIVVWGGNTGNETGSDWREVAASDGRSAARLATISSISLKIAPSAATSCADLSSSEMINWNYNLFQRQRASCLLLHESLTDNSSFNCAWRCSNWSSCCRMINSSSRFFSCVMFRQTSSNSLRRSSSELPMLERLDSLSCSMFWPSPRRVFSNSTPWVSKSFIFKSISSCSRFISCAIRNLDRDNNLISSREHWQFCFLTAWVQPASKLSTSHAVSSTRSCFRSFGNFLHLWIIYNLRPEETCTWT